MRFLFVYCVYKGLGWLSVCECAADADLAAFIDCVGFFGCVYVRGYTWVGVVIVEIVN